MALARRPVAQRELHLSRLLQADLGIVDDHGGTGHAGGVDLAVVRAGWGADGVDVQAGAEPRAADDGFPGRGQGAHDVGAPDDVPDVRADDQVERGHAVGRVAPVQGVAEARIRSGVRDQTTTVSTGRMRRIAATCSTASGPAPTSPRTRLSGRASASVATALVAAVRIRVQVPPASTASRAPVVASSRITVDCCTGPVGGAVGLGVGEDLDGGEAEALRRGHHRQQHGGRGGVDDGRGGLGGVPEREVGVQGAHGVDELAHVDGRGRLVVQEGGHRWAFMNASSVSSV